MAGERTLPGVGLTGFWDVASDGWAPGMDDNLRRLSAGLASRLIVKSQTTSLPGTPSLGDIYIVPDGDANEKQIAIWDGSAGSEVWNYYPAFEGLRAYAKDISKDLLFDGTDWGVVASGATPVLQVGRSSSQSIPNGANTLITPQVEFIDTETVWDPGTNPTRLPALGTGVHRLTANLRFDSTNASIVYQVWTTLNRAGSTAYNVDLPDGNEEGNMDPYTTVRRGIRVNGVFTLNASDYIELVAYIFSSDSGPRLLNTRTRITLEFLG